MNSLDVLLSSGAATAARTTPCIIGQTVASLPDKYRTAVEEQFATPWNLGGSSDFEIASRLNAAGFKASPASVNRHRGGRCTCPPKEK